MLAIMRSFFSLYKFSTMERKNRDYEEIPAERPSQPKRTSARDAFWAILLKDQADLQDLAIPFDSREAFATAFEMVAAKNPHLLQVLCSWLENRTVQTRVLKVALPGQTVQRFELEDGWRVLFLDVEQLQKGDFELSVSKDGHFATTHLKDVLFYNVAQYR